MERRGLESTPLRLLRPEATSVTVWKCEVWSESEVSWEESRDAKACEQRGCLEYVPGKQERREAGI